MAPDLKADIVNCSDFLPSVHGSHEDEAVNKYHTTEMFVSGVLGHSDVPERVLRRMGLAALARKARRHSYEE